MLPRRRSLLLLLLARHRRVHTVPSGGRVRWCRGATRLGLIAAMCLPGGALTAQLAPIGGPTAVPRVTEVRLDNDLFALRDSGPPSDRDYTHGLEVTVHWRAVPDRVRAWLRLREGDEGPGDGAAPRHRLSAGLRQAMYTPASNEDRRRPGERPHAGYLAAHATLTRVAPHRQRSLRLEVGTTGRPALAAPMQRAMHAITGSSQQRGWQHELGARPVLDVSYDEAWQRDGARGGVAARAVGRWGAQTGTLRTAVAVEGSLRLALDRTRLALPTDGAVALPLGPFVTTTLRQEAVARDLFVDGHFGDRSITTRREALVSETAFGLGWRFAGGLTEYRHVRRGREYAAQAGPHSYGSLRFTWYYR